MKLVMFILLAILGTATLLLAGKLTVMTFLLMLTAVFFFTFMLGTLQEVRFMSKYRDEYEACAAAVLADNAKMADEVNAWTTHYYVHKQFYFVADKGSSQVGYKLSIRDRPREGGFAGGTDMGIYVPFQ